MSRSNLAPAAGAQVGRQLEPERPPAEATVAQDAEGADAVDAAHELREVLVAPPAVRPDSPHQVADRQVDFRQDAAAGDRGRPRQGLDEQAQLDGDAAALGHVVPAESIEDLEPGGWRDHVALGRDHVREGQLPPRRGRRNGKGVPVLGCLDDADAGGCRQHGGVAPVSGQGLAGGRQNAERVVGDFDSRGELCDQGQAAGARRRRWRCGAGQ